MTRRRLLQGAAAAAGGAAVARLGLQPSDAAPRGPILCCDTYSVRQLFDAGKLTAETAPAFYKELNIPAIAYNDWYIKAWDDAGLDTLKRAAKDAGITLSALVCGANFATPDEAERKRQVELAKTRMRAAKRLGISVLRLDTGGVAAGEDSAGVGVERVTAAFRELLPLARELKQKLTIENHGGVSGSADNILRIIQGTDPKIVGSCLDFGNWPDDVRYESCERLATHAYHVHAKSYSFGADGEEERIDFGRILGMLRKAKYRLAISIEFEGGGDPVEGVKRTRDLIRKHWPGL